MKKSILITFISSAVLLTCAPSVKSTRSFDSLRGTLASHPDGFIIGHTYIDISQIPEQWISGAKELFKIAYGHTSHGSQIVSGMNALAGANPFYSFNSTGSGGALYLRDTPFSGASDLGNPNRTQWEASTRTYLNANPQINLVMWSWCGQVSSATEADINTYLNLMNGLEESYPNVRFVYMTGHLDGSGLAGNLHQRNEQIRRYCQEHKKILFDFEDIESYDPDNNYFGDKRANDGCSFDSNGDGSLDSNWADNWCAGNENPPECSNTGCAHSTSLNCNMKANAFWALLARLAGWDGE